MFDDCICSTDNKELTEALEIFIKSGYNPNTLIQPLFKKQYSKLENKKKKKKKKKKNYFQFKIHVVPNNVL